MAWLITAIAIVIGVPLLIAAGAILMDALTLWGVLKPLTEVDIHIGKVHEVLFIHLPGMLFDGIRGCDPFQSTLDEYGDTARVAYRGHRFNAEALVQYAALRINSDIAEYKHVVLIGTSMGGKLAFDLRPLLAHQSVSVALIDTPIRSSNLLMGGNIAAPLMKYLPFGRVSNVVFAPLMKMMLQPPEPENIEPHLDPDQVIAQAKVSLGKWKLSIWRDQLQYIAERKVTHDDVAVFDRVMYVTCTRNNVTVAPSAVSDFEEVANCNVVIIDMHTTHCGYAEAPIETGRVFKEIAERILTVA